MEGRRPAFPPNARGARGSRKEVKAYKLALTSELRRAKSMQSSQKRSIQPTRLLWTLCLIATAGAQSQPLGPQFQVNSYTTNQQLAPVVGPDGAGGFIVVWTSFGSAGSDRDGSSIQAQRYGSNG